MSRDKRKLFVAGNYNLAASTVVGAPYSRTLFQHSLWLSLHIWCGVGLLPQQNLCWVCFSPIWLSWCYTVCSSSHPIGETNITTSPCYTDKNPEDSHIRSFNWISRQVTRSLMCQKWLFRNQQTVSCCVSLPSLCWLAVLYSLENHFWAAQTCLSMLIALLLFAHTILRALGWWHTLCDIHFLARSG